MKNFDQDLGRTNRREADRMFQIGGETFTRKASVRPEVLTEFEDMDAGHPAADALRIIDDLIVELLEPHDNAAARWHALREREEDALSAEDMQSLVEWLIGEMTGRPTSKPSSSTSSPATLPPGTPSTAASPSDQVLTLAR